MVNAVPSTAAALPTSCGARRKSRARWLVQVRLRRLCSAGVKLITTLDIFSAVPQGLEAEVLFQINLIKSEKHFAIDLIRSESLTNCRRKDLIHQPSLISIVSSFVRYRLFPPFPFHHQSLFFHFVELVTVAQRVQEDTDGGNHRIGTTPD